MAITNTPNHGIPRNKLFQALPEVEQGRLGPLLTYVHWVNGQGIYEADDRIEHVYFVEQGFASVVADAEEFSIGVEVGILGWESMVGMAALFDPDAAAFNRVFVQLPGGAYRMSASVLRDNLEHLPTLGRLLHRASQIFMAQVAQTAACNSRHSLAQRLARWLLMAHDRADGDELFLTQEFLSTMLAVRRTGVTLAIGTLQTADVITCHRGRIFINDRPGLEAVACTCYGRVNAFAASMARSVP